MDIIGTVSKLYSQFMMALILSTPLSTLAEAMRIEVKKLAPDKYVPAELIENLLNSYAQGLVEVLYEKGYTVEEYLTEVRRSILRGEPSFYDPGRETQIQLKDLLNNDKDGQHEVQQLLQLSFRLSWCDDVERISHPELDGLVRTDQSFDWTPNPDIEVLN